MQQQYRGIKLINITLLILSGFFISGAHFIGKFAMKKGVQPTSYNYGINIVMLFLIIPFTLFFNFEIQTPIGLTVIILIILASIARWVNLFGLVNGINKTSPLEMTSFASVSIVLTYFIDVMLNTVTLNLLSILFLIVIIISSYYMTIKVRGIPRIKTIVLAYVITNVLRGYTTHFSLNYMSEIAFAFIIALLSFLFFLALTPKLKPGFRSVKFGFLAQGFGIINFVALIYLAGNSTTLYMLAFPVRLAMTILLSFFIKKVQSKELDPDYIHKIIASIIILISATGYVISQI